MSPEDPRHGTNGGYLAGCRDQCCRDAHAAGRRNMRARRYLRGVDRLYIDATGTQRRIRALQAIGWRLFDLDAQMGCKRGWTHNITSQAKVHVDTAAKVADLYERLSMTLGPSERTRTLARNWGWPTPLAWDNPDTDDAPRGIRTTNRRDLLTEWAELEAAGESIDQAARRLGVTPGAIERAVFRARKGAA